MDRFLNLCEYPKLNHKKIKILNNTIILNETEAGINNLITKKRPRSHWITNEFYNYRGHSNSFFP